MKRPELCAIVGIKWVKDILFNLNFFFNMMFVVFFYL